MIFERISDNIPPQMKVLNMVIPILMHFYNFLSNWSVASGIKPHKSVHNPTKCDVINDFKLLPIVYHRIYCRKFLMLSNHTSCYKSMCIRIKYWFLHCLSGPFWQATSVQILEIYHSCHSTSGHFLDQAPLNNTNLSFNV